MRPPGNGDVVSRPSHHNAPCNSTAGQFSAAPVRSLFEEVLRGAAVVTDRSQAWVSGMATPSSSATAAPNAAGSIAMTNAFCR